MPGPIRSFIDTLQERQPVRNAIRDFVGMPRRYGSVIDPMEEMTARDRERGQDISREGLPNRRLASTAAMAVEPEGMAMPIPEGPPAPMRSGAPDPLQPYKGMSLAQAAVTAPSDALKRYDGMPPRQRSAQPAGQGGDFASRIGQISQSSLDQAQKYEQMAIVALNAAAAPNETKERRAALMRIGENYMKMSERFNERDYVTLRRDKEMADAAKYEKQMMEAQTEDALGRAKGVAALPENMMRERPNVPVSVFATQRGQTALDQAIASGKGIPPGAIDAATKLGYEEFLPTRVAQHAEEMAKGGRIFDEDHPGFAEIQSFYRDALGTNPTPEEYDILRNKLTRQIYLPLGAAARALGEDPRDVAQYLENLSASIMGPRPRQRQWSDVLPSFDFGSWPTIPTEAFTGEK